jgi:hypothetical protein
VLSVLWSRAIMREDKDKDVRLVLALGASEPCYGAEDDDEDDADEETPAVWRRSVMLNSESIVRKYPFAIL